MVWVYDWRIPLVGHDAAEKYSDCRTTGPVAEAWRRPWQPGRSPYSRNFPRGYPEKDRSSTPSGLSMHRGLTLRDLAFLAGGLILGAGLLLALAPLPLRSSARSPHSSAPPAVVAGNEAATPRAVPDWAQIVAKLRSPDETRPRSLILLGRLDEATLQKLATEIPTWPENRQRDLTLRDVFRRWAELAPQAAIAQAQRVQMPLGFSAARAAVSGFVAAYPARASALLAAPPAPDQGPVLRVRAFRDNQLAEALLNWSEQDAQAAIEFLMQLPPGELGPRTVSTVTAAWARRDPAVALTWASQLMNPLLRTAALRGALAAWAESDPLSAAGYVSGLPLGAGRDILTGTVVRQWVQQDPSSAAAWAASQTGVARERALVAVAGGWAESDPTAAAAWAAQLPPSHARDAAWEEVATAWSLANSAAAAEWLGTLPAGPGRDAAILGLTAGLGSVDPVQTLGWVQQIGNLLLRDDTMVRVLQGWLAQNPAAAQQWISQTPLSPGVRARL